MLLRTVYRRKWLLGLWLIVLTLAWAGVVQAGGWAVLTLERWPTEIAANEPFTIEFAVRQHGIHLMEGLSPKITAVHPSGDRLTFNASEMTQTGHYQAELLLPHTGAWLWQINAFSYDHLMPPLQVGAAESAAVAAKPAALPTSLPTTIGIASLGATAVAFFAWWQQRTRLRLAFTAITAVIAVVALTVPWGSVTAVAEQPTQPASALADMGEILFVAKGCIMCHQHDGVTSAHNFAPVGPNLSHYVGNPEYLESWLKDPSALKPATEMPDLGLKLEEIQILTAYLSQPKGD